MSQQASHIDGADQRVLSHLTRLQQSFEPSLKTGGEPLISFHKSLDAMLADCSSTTLQGATHAKVSSFVSMVKTISIALLDLEEKSQAIQAAFSVEITRLAEVEFKRLSIHDSPLPSTTHSPSFAYIEPCYKWLLGHLHNPYPSRKLREQISAGSGIPAKHIDAWFIDVRKRIGWNRIRRAYFETRADMVKAATRHFNSQVRTVRPTSFKRLLRDETDSIDYGAEFVAMQSDAQTLYAHKLFPTTVIDGLATKFDTLQPRRRDAVSSYPSPEPTPPPQEQSPPHTANSVGRLPKRRNSDVGSDDEATLGISRLQRPLKRSRASIPSPNHGSPSSILPSPAQTVYRELPSSISPSTTPSPLPETSITPHPQPSKRKRRLSNASEYDSDCSRAPRVRRRRRVGEDEYDARLPPEVANSKQELEGAEAIHPLPLSSSLPDPSLSQSQTLKRKRRLSDTHDERPRKLPHHPALMAPRLHTVSNPLPVTSPFSDLDGLPTTLPAELPVFSDTVDFDDLRNLNVESFDYGSLPILEDYLCQSDLASNKIDNNNFNTSTPVLSIVSESCPTFQLQGPVSGTGLRLDLDFATANQLPPSSYDELLSGVQGAAHAITSEVVHNFLPAADTPLSVTVGQAFDSTFDHHTSALPGQSSSINPFDLILYPAPNISTHETNPVMVADHRLGLSSGPAFVNGDALQASFAFQTIQALQAELEMCKSQLAQCGVMTF